MSKAPAFQFYAKDWLDMRVMRMSFEAQGVYIRLLAHIWADTDTQFSIENNHRMLSRMIGISEKKFKKIFAEIQWPNDPIFILEDGFLVSKRLKREREKQIKISTKRSEAAQNRWAENDANAYANAYANAKQMECKRDALQSSSSSSKTEKTKEESSLRSDSCAEVAKPPTAPKPVKPKKFLVKIPDQTPLRGTLPLANGTYFEVRQSLVDELAPLYPAVDVLAALRSMKSWLIGNPRKRKTKRGIMAFITGWLDRDQNQGGSMPPPRASPSYPLTPRQQQTERFKGMAMALKNREAMGNGGNHEGGCGGDADALLAVLPGPGCERGHHGDSR